MKYFLLFLFFITIFFLIYTKKEKEEESKSKPIFSTGITFDKKNIEIKSENAQKNNEKYQEKNNNLKKDKELNKQKLNSGRISFTEIVKPKEQNFTPYSDYNLFFKDDNSYLRYVSPDYSFNNLKYIPDDLVPLKGDYIVDFKGNSLIRKEALNSLNNLAKDFFQKFGKKLIIVSAYRSYEYQKGIKDRGCSDYYCAKAGFSEHQSGLAVDFFETTTKKEFLSKYQNYFNFLKNNAHKYGFHNTYQKGREIDGYEIEPWHFRYLGIDFATFLYNKNMTFGEYIKTLIN